MRTASEQDPEALRPPPGNPRFPLFDGLRAVAAFSVVVTHASGLSNFNTQHALGPYAARMNVGVTIFFLISGFLLYRPFVRAAHAGEEPPRVLRFFRRRALRILPAYWLALTVLAATIGLGGVWDRPWVYYGLVQVYRANDILGGIGPAWSLCIEVAFYLVLPFLALALRNRGLRTSALVVAALALASIGLRTLIHVLDDTTTFPYTLPGTFFWFALGMLLAIASVALEGREDRVAATRLVAERPWVAWAAAAVVFWFMSTQAGLPVGGLDYSELTFLAEHVLYGLFAFFLLLPAVFGDARGGWPRAAIGNRVMAWLGLVSYGVYLWHTTLMVEFHDQGVPDWLPSSPFLALLLPTAAAATACAALSYYLVERPLLKLKDPRPPRRPQAEPTPRAQAEPAPTTAG